MKNLLRTALLLPALLFSFFTVIRAEGTKEVMPNSANGVALSVAPGVSAGPYRAAAAQNRIRFYITNATTENFYFGYRAYDRSTTPVEIQIYYRIVNAAGTQIVAPTLLNTTAGTAGRINTYAQAVAGPNIGGLNPSGYSPRTFDPAANGEYFIEFYESTDAGATATAAEFLLVYFDFTVATATNVKYPGRVYCQAWNFITYIPATFVGDLTKPMEGDFYGYTLDSTIARIDLNAGFKPFRFTLYLNKNGVANTGVWDNDRKSVTTGATAPTLTGGFNVFLNTPDATLFPNSAAPASPVLNKVYGCPGGYFIPYKISMPGDVAILLDLNGTAGYQAGTADRYLFAYDVTVGNQVMNWNGLNGLGASVAAGTSLNVTIFLRRGRTNMPMYDAEQNQNGLTVTGVAPLASNPKIYWDDASLTNSGTVCDAANANNNTTGVGINNSIVGALSPAHAWDGPGANLTVPAPTGSGGSATANLCDDYGNVRTLNTWFWPVEVSSVNNNIVLPGCDTDGDGISNTIDLDDDNDGIADTVESGGNPQGDADSDGIPNYLDPSPGTGVPAYVDANGDGVNDAYDKDGDGVINALDKDSDNDGIPDLAEAGGVDTNGDGTVDYTGTFASNDTDADGLINRYDVALIANPDTDSDGIYNYLDLDSDNDGIPDVTEVGGVDANGDGRLDNYNDTDGDGFDDTADGDVGNDGTAENTANALLVTGADGATVDGKPDTYVSGITNADGRGLPNPYDVDSDDDGIADIIEAGGTDTNNDGKVDGFADSDGDGFSNSVDGDANNDGTAENTAGALVATGADANNNGKADSYLATDNADGSGMPNPYDLDSDDDSIPDLIESGGVDSNGDGRIDAASDADGNGWQASYDPTQSGINIRIVDANGATTGGAVFDFDSDGIANYIDLDSDNDGIPDIIEQEGTDSNNDGKADATTDADSDGFIDTVDPLNNGTGVSLGTAIITTGSTLSAQNMPTTYSAGDNLDGKGLLNMLDLDADDDGILDTREAGLTDATNDGIADGALGADGWSDAVDALASLNHPNTDAHGRANYLDIDSDNDGIPDIIEGQSTVGYTAPANADADADGIDDTYDNNDALFAGAATNGITPVNTDGTDNPDYIDLDSDNDNYSDRIEGWDVNGNNIINGAEIAYVGTTDTDSDGLLDEYDVNDAAINPTNGTTPASYPNADKATTTERDWREGNDADGDGVSDNIDIDDDNDGVTDVAESGGVAPLGDADGDGVPNYVDTTPGTGVPAFSDSNSDGVSDAFDADKDGIINAWDLDSDNDGIADIAEAGGVDTNGDGRIDGAFADSDGDGLANTYDASSGGVAIANPDTDGDGVLNLLDLDSDNDGIPDVVEAGGTDANNDGALDGFTDTDGDGFAQIVDGDANNDGTAENTAAALIITGTDDNADGKPDTYPRANQDNNGLPNPYDLDADGDGILDVREGGLTDTNGDGITDGTLGADGWSDTVDALTSLNLINTDGRGKPNYLDIDADDDGIVDNVEGQSTAGYAVPINADSDGDGIDNQYDNNDALFAGSANNGIVPVNTDGIGLADYADLDSDNDGYPDFFEGHDTGGDNLPDAGSNANNGAPGGTADADNDGLPDGYDNNTASVDPTNGTNATSYPNIDNTGTTERDWREIANTDNLGGGNTTDIDDDNDGIPDLSEYSGSVDPLGDADGDGIRNYVDGTPGSGVPAFVDANSDGISDAFDNDKDGIINSLDLDSDNDGIADIVEAGGVDTNGDGKVDAGTDTDGDGLADKYDVTNGGVHIANLNTDGDGSIPNVRDLDSDNDGIPDVVEGGGTDTNNDGRIDSYTDANGDGWSDAVTGASNALIITGTDGNSDGLPDLYTKANLDAKGFSNPYDLDSDGDGITDYKESGLSVDTDNNSVINSSDAGYTDTNGDGWSDMIDALVSLNLPNTDGAGNLNYLDIDADDDGITDNVEGQATLTYAAPSNTDSDGDGIDNQYDNFVGFGGAGITPVNTDGADDPDYGDADSDNDNLDDRVEGNDYNGNSKSDDVVTPLGTDTDSDGLDDRYETAINNGPIVTIFGFSGAGAGGRSPAGRTGLGDRDWRNSLVVLPVRFITVAARKQGAGVSINWMVADEHNVKIYEVERRSENGVFETIGTVPYQPSGSAENSYRFFDNTAASGTIFYRIRQVDWDGAFTRSGIVQVQLAPFVTGLTLYPNPVQGTSQLEVTASVAQTVRLVVTDVQGRILTQQTVQVQKGRNIIAANALQALPAGTYILSGAIDGKQHQTTFIKQ